MIGNTCSNERQAKKQENSKALNRFIRKFLDHYLFLMQYSRCVQEFNVNENTASLCLFKNLF